MVSDLGFKNDRDSGYRGEKGLAFNVSSEELAYTAGSTSKVFWWCFGAHGGKWVLLGPYPSEDRAHEVGRHAYEGTFEKFDLKTRDKSRATQEIKAIMLSRGIEAEDGEALTNAMQKVRHSIRDYDVSDRNDRRFNKRRY